jgi:hypothetical protein
MTVYTKEYKRQKMYLREFLFMEIEFVSKRVGNDECEACLTKTRGFIKELFEYADCSNSGAVTSE